MDHRIEVCRINGMEHAYCNACFGSGVQHFAHTDPERDWSEPCEVCEARGQWRIAEPDSLEVLAMRRRVMREMRFSPYFSQLYGEARQTAVSPVFLPPLRREEALPEAA